MHPADLLAEAFSRLEGIFPDTSGAEDGVCCITGAYGPSIPRKAVISSSFTDRAGMWAPDSDRIGVNAVIALRYGFDTGNKRPRRPELQDSWWCDGQTIDYIDRPTARERILNGYDTARPWCAYINLSGKKHGVMRAVCNSGPRGRWAFDEYVVDCRSDRVNRWYDRLRQAQRDGIGRQSIPEASMPPLLIKKVGFGVWYPFEQWARPRVSDPLYKLCVYLLPTVAELKENPDVI